MEVPSVIPDGARNDTVYRLAASMRANSVPFEEAMDECGAVNESRCSPPLPSGEVEATVRSAYTKPEGYSPEVLAKVGARKRGQANPPTAAGHKGGGGRRKVDYSLDVSDEMERLPSPPTLSPAEQFAEQARAMLRPGERVNVVCDARGGRPIGSGMMLTYESATTEPATFLGLAGDPGMWLRVNPTSGRHAERGARGEGNADVTDLRNVLVEADPEGADKMTDAELDESKRRQLARIVALRLPCAAVVDSGHKSVHAIVQVEDEGEHLDRQEWERRRDMVYAVCDANGLAHDPSCKNPSRLCRVAGARRGGHVQTLLATRSTEPRLFGTFREWEQWVGASVASPADAAEGASTPEHVRVSNLLMGERGMCVADGIPCIRDGGSWATGWRGVERAALDYSPNMKSNARREVLKYLELVAPRTSQADKRFIAFSNGILDLSTMTMVDGCDGPMLNVIPHRWNPGAESDAADRTLAKLADGDEATVANIEEAMGLCLYRNSSDCQFIFCLLGDGSNGKSVLLDAVSCMLGRENVTAMQPDDLDRQFQAEQLMGKLALLADDASSSLITEHEKASMKRVSAGNIVHTDIKGQPGCDFTPYATMLVSWNRFPRVAGAEFGFMRRLVPVPFTHTFSPDDADYDPQIRDHLRGEAAQERLLVRAVSGLCRLLRRGRPTVNARGDEMKGDIAAESDSIQAWVYDECVSTQSLLSRSTDEVYSGYSSWCESSGFDAASKVAFGRAVKRRFGVLSKPEKSHGSTYRVYVSGD